TAVAESGDFRSATADVDDEMGSGLERVDPAPDGTGDRLGNQPDLPQTGLVPHLEQRTTLERRGPGGSRDDAHGPDAVAAARRELGEHCRDECPCRFEIDDHPVAYRVDGGDPAGCAVDEVARLLADRERAARFLRP